MNSSMLAVAAIRQPATAGRGRARSARLGCRAYGRPPMPPNDGGDFAQCTFAGVFRLMVTFLRCVKLSSMPSSENSRPMPLCLTPP